MMIRHRRQGRSMRLDRNKRHTLYSEWKAERIKAMEKRTPHQVMVDAAYQAANQNDNYYSGLVARIEARQESKVPIAGAGAVEFLSYASDFAKASIPYTGIVGQFSYGAFETAERIARSRSGINE